MIESVLFNPVVAAGLFVASLIFAMMVVWGVFLPKPRSYETATVTVRGPEGTVKGTLTARVADTLYKQFVGLSHTDELGSDEGMVFVHTSDSKREYAMRGMTVSIDLLFADADGHIVDIGSMKRPRSTWRRVLYPTYTSTGQIVVEAPYGWADSNGVTEGDIVRIESAD